MNGHESDLFFHSLCSRFQIYTHTHTPEHRQYSVSIVSTVPTIVHPMMMLLFSSRNRDIQIETGHVFFCCLLFVENRLMFSSYNNHFSILTLIFFFAHHFVFGSKESSSSSFDTIFCKHCKQIKKN